MITIIAATVTIVFLTFFMLLEGRRWVERVYSLFPEESQPRWRRVGHDIYRTVGGYVTGNILISLIAGASITIVLLVMGVPYAVALGLLVAVLDLIPLAGATVAGVIVCARRVPALRAGRHRRPSSSSIVYQQLENHFLQPVIYGRTVQLSPLVVLDLGARRRGARRHPRCSRGDPGRRRAPGDRSRPAGGASRAAAGRRAGG